MEGKVAENGRRTCEVVKRRRIPISSNYQTEKRRISE
jgi:hypothetical protein